MYVYSRASQKFGNSVTYRKSAECTNQPVFWQKLCLILNAQASIFFKVARNSYSSNNRDNELHGTRSSCSQLWRCKFVPSQSSKILKCVGKLHRKNSCGFHLYNYLQTFLQAESELSEYVCVAWSPARRTDFGAILRKLMWICYWDFPFNSWLPKSIKLSKTWLYFGRKYNFVPRSWRNMFSGVRFGLPTQKYLCQRAITGAMKSPSHELMMSHGYWGRRAVDPRGPRVRKVIQQYQLQN